MSATTTVPRGRPDRRKPAAVVEEQLVAAIAIEIDADEHGQRGRCQLAAGTRLALGIEDHDAPPSLRIAETDADVPSATAIEVGQTKRCNLIGCIAILAAAPGPADRAIAAVQGGHFDGLLDLSGACSLTITSGRPSPSRSPTAKARDMGATWLS